MNMLRDTREVVDMGVVNKGGARANFTFRSNLFVAVAAPSRHGSRPRTLFNNNGALETGNGPRPPRFECQRGPATKPECGMRPTDDSAFHVPDLKVCCDAQNRIVALTKGGQPKMPED